jgi:hypothetical protein
MANAATAETTAFFIDTISSWVLIARWAFLRPVQVMLPASIGGSQRITSESARHVDKTAQQLPEPPCRAHLSVTPSRARDLKICSKLKYFTLEATRQLGQYASDSRFERS